MPMRTLQVSFWAMVMVQVALATPSLTFTTIAPTAGCYTVGVVAGYSPGPMLLENCPTASTFKFNNVFVDATYPAPIFVGHAPPVAIDWSYDNTCVASQSGTDNIYVNVATTEFTLTNGVAGTVSVGSKNWLVAVNSAKNLYQATSSLTATMAPNTLTVSWYYMMTDVLAASVGRDGTLCYITTASASPLCCQLLSTGGCSATATSMDGNFIGVLVDDASNIIAWNSAGQFSFLNNGYYPGNPNTPSWVTIAGQPCALATNATVAGPTSTTNAPHRGPGQLFFPCNSAWYQGTFQFQCPPGTYGSSGTTTCTSCAAGTFSDTIGATSSSTCSACPAGFYSLAGASTCIGCSPGFYGPSTGLSTCVGCPAGTYGPFPDQTSAAFCLSCPAGSSSPSGSTGCPLCAAGKYSSASGSSTCSCCATGSYNTAAGSTGCVDCQHCDSHSAYPSSYFGTCTPSGGPTCSTSFGQCTDALVCHCNYTP